MKKLALSAGIFAATSLSLGVVSPAHAAQCSGFYTITQLTTGGFSCELGDKQFSGFNGFTGLASTSGFTFTKMGASHTFQGTGLNAPVGTYTYGYTVALFNPPPGQAFKSFVTDSSGSDTGGTFNYNKTLSSDAPDDGDSVSSAPGSSGNMASFTTPFPDGQIDPVTFSATINVTQGVLTGTTDSVNQLRNGDAVPGPLPLLGAGAAFGFSRKIRRRIQASA
jgi:hypothetical protein